MKNFKKSPIFLMFLFIIILPIKVKAEDYKVSMCPYDSCKTSENAGIYLFDNSVTGNWYYEKNGSMVYRPVVAQNVYYNSLSTNVLVYYYSHYIKIGGNYQSGSLCIDPILVTAEKVKQKRTLNPYIKDPYKDRISIQSTYDAAILSIFESDANLAAKETAVRLITSAWNFHNVNNRSVYNNETQAWDFLNTYSNTAEAWISELSLSTKWSLASGQLEIKKNSKGSTTSTLFASNSPHYSILIGRNDLGLVKELFKNAILAAYDAYTSNPTVDATKILKRTTVGDINIEEKNGEYHLKRTVEYNINTAGLSNLEIYNLTSTKGKITLDNASLNTNVLGKGKLQFTISAKESELNVGADTTIKYGIYFKYCFSQTGCKTAYVFESTNDTTQEQRLIWYDTTGLLGNGFKAQISDSITLRRPCDTKMNISNNCDVATTGTITTKEDSKCYLSNYDDVGNTYKINTNKYQLFNDVTACSNIYCKEEYDINFDTTYNANITNKANEKFKYVTSGRYFKLQAKINGKIVCYADIDSFYRCKDMPAEIAAKYVMLKGKSSVNQEIDTNKKQFEEQFKQFNFLNEKNIELQYKYEDKYYTNEKNYNEATYKDMSKTVDIESMNIDLCNDKTDACESVNSNNYLQTENGTGQEYVSVSFTPAVKDLTNKYGNNSNDYYVKITINATATYTSKNLYQNYYTSGQIYQNDQDTSKLIKQNLKEIDGLPIKIDTAKGLYKYNFKITNLGDFYDTGDSGRLIGNSKSVYNKLYKEGKAKFNGEYVCYYFVNCPDCEPSCEKGTCKWDPNCPTCKDVCVNCLYDSNKLKVTFRQITTENLNPNDRKLGYNWNEKTNFELISEKAAATKTEIEKNTAKIEQETPILKVDMTYDMAQYIKGSTSNSYGDDTLECYDYVENNETKYENIFCYSTVLDDLQNKYKDNVTFISTRTNADKRKDNDTTISKSGYWTIFKKATEFTLGDYNGPIGGPSWK